MRKVGLAQAKAQLSAQLSAQLDAVEAGEEVVITRRGHPVARIVRERRRSAEAPDRVSWLRDLHADQPGPTDSAVRLMRELRHQEP